MAISFAKLKQYDDCIRAIDKINPVVDDQMRYLLGKLIKLK